MLRFRLGFGVVILAVGSVACGGGGSSTPTAPSPTTTSITVNFTGTQLFLGATETFTATATLSNGTTQNVTTGTWGTDAPSVATVTPAGAVTGVASGEVTVFVDFQGVRGTKRITVRPNFQGNWVGSYSVTGCNPTGAWVSFCDNFSNGRVLPLRLNLTQSGATVSGRTALGTLLSDNFTASISTSGVLQIVATYRDGTLTIDQVWTLHSTVPTRITGTLTQTWRDSGFSGQMVVHTNVFNTNTESSALSAMESSGPSIRSLQDALQALARSR